MKNMDKNDFFQTMNERLISAFSDSPGLNYCRFLLPEKKGQVSVVAKYTPCACVEQDKDGRILISEEPFITLAKSDTDEGGVKEVESRDYDSYYYGISPAVNETVIVGAIADGRLKDTEGLNRFIAEHCSGFMLRRNQVGYLRPCAKLFVLSIAHNFGIKLRVDEPLYTQLLDFSDTTLVEEGTEKGEILLCGSPTEELFCKLDEYRFRWNNDTMHWEQCNSCGEGLSVREIFRDVNNIILLKGNTFYSGALLRVLYINAGIRTYGNDTLAPLQFLFERSSYGTVFTLDNCFFRHPLLSSCMDKIVEMYRIDDDCRRALLKSTATVGKRADYLDAVNNYLKNTFNVNQIGVTGNLITKDGILVIGEREASSIDAGEVYPSVNGNAEVMDANVSFYKLSANEDYPTIELSSNRIDFCGELNREAYAELAVTPKSDAWKCYGFTVSGFVPGEYTGNDYPFNKRRMHFNILCEQACDVTFEEIIKRQKTATESFENHTLKGLQLSYYANRRKKIGAGLIKCIRLALNSESHIGEITAVYVFLATIITAVQNKSLMSLTFTASDISKVIFSALGIFMICVAGYKAVKNYLFRKKHIVKINFIGSRTSRAKDGFSQITSYFAKNPSHPVAYAAVMARVLNISEYK